jgi:hypothetical protein
MRRCLILLTIAVASLAQEAVTIPSGVPLRVALEKRVAIKHAGEPIRGPLVEPVYVFDRIVLPAGSIVEGHIAEIGGVPATRRLKAVLSGNFTPLREVRAQFDAVVLSDGTRLPLRTSPSRGTEHTVRVVKRGKKQDGRRSAPQIDAAIRAFRAPGKMSRLKNALLGMLPYHRQSWAAGTLFNAALQDPLVVPARRPVEASFDPLVVAGPESRDVRARLLTSLNSATARRGAPVEAVVTRPLFSADHQLLIPEGSRLFGDVIEAQRARRLHRNGKLLFVFRRIELPRGAERSVQGYLEGVEADFDAHLALDSEGGTRARSPKSRFIFPAIAAAAAGLSLHQDYNAEGVPDQDIGGRAESGAVGLGLVGTFLAQTSRAVASSIAFTGAAFSVYSTFIARGEDVVLPVNTPVEISLRTR